MTDFQGFLIVISAFVLKLIFGIVLLPWSIYIACREKRLNKYFYEIGRGLDILAGKLFEPVFNKRLIKPGGRKYGGDVTISHDMAINKLFGYNTKDADYWEKQINKIDKDHLNKTLKNYERRN